MFVCLHVVIFRSPLSRSHFKVGPLKSAPGVKNNITTWSATASKHDWNREREKSVLPKADCNAFGMDQRSWSALLARSENANSYNIASLQWENLLIKNVVQKDADADRIESLSFYYFQRIIPLNNLITILYYFCTRSFLPTDILEPAVRSRFGRTPPPTLKWYWNT